MTEKIEPMTAAEYRREWPKSLEQGINGSRNILGAQKRKHVLPALGVMVAAQVTHLRAVGSVAAPGFANPEGVVVFHVAANLAFKVTCEKDEQPKSKGVK